ncbi:MAG TPA: hypothetical protein VFL59_03775 [Candidatus Nanopelagicales bacterium]|nr:hypothetical protein [Candidatus Nanopelagicales bacterium]
MSEARQELPTKAGRRRTAKLALVAVSVLLVVGGLLAWRANLRDSDGDGITDRVELAGWRSASGEVYRTDPDRADTDGDGLTDLDEAGAHASGSDAADEYVGYSDPLVADTDADGLTDGGEADAGLDPRDKDGDDDGLADGYEVTVVSTDPQSADTDRDGFTDGYEDANRESQGLDPLSVDTKITALEYAAEFAKGALAGELLPGDSLAWLSGNLTSTASGLIPGVGALVGGAADLRDALGAAIHGDWVSAGYDAVGVIPGGDFSEIPRKATLFLARHPKLIVQVATLIAKARLVPDVIKIRATRAIWTEWDELVRAGASEKSLLILMQGRTDLHQLASGLRRRLSADGPVSVPMASGRAGEVALEARYGATTTGVDRQVRLSTAGCTTGCGGDIRIVDVLVNGIAHESKVGYVGFSEFTQRQIFKDAYLIRMGRISGALWHFSMSDVTHTIGADPRVLDLLEKVGIPYETQLPAAA